ncbi:hypothetical protein [Streptomyces sp. NPDC050264]|uniref:hypothetical protein n=1 Tax=Streptomyces sp. NPDC050264 TaxID=3155038 RepID=UPI003443AB1D
MATEPTARGITDSISASTVRRWLHQNAIKPWQHRSWIFIRNPDSRATAQRVPDLYARTFDGKPLGAGEYVIPSDEKGRLAHRLPRPAPGPGPARAFEDRYNATAQPCQWRFTTSDLDDLLARPDRHTLADRQEESSVAPTTRSTPGGLPKPTT